MTGPSSFLAAARRRSACGEDDGDVAGVSCDGELIGQLGAGDRVAVAAAPDPVQLIHPVGYDYFAILRGKLHWGRGNRPSRTVRLNQPRC